MSHNRKASRSDSKYITHCTKIKLYHTHLSSILSKMASQVDAVQDFIRPAILRLPVELQLHILTFLSFKLKKCRLTRAGHYCTPVPWDRPPVVFRCPPAAFQSRTHKYNASTCYRIKITDPAILSLRYTNVQFSMLIPLTHELLLEVERWYSSYGSTLLACCVCLRLQRQRKFAVQAATTVQDIEEEEDIIIRHRFCTDCGFSTYPHPHPVLPPRRQQRRLGEEPQGLTTYAPGTKLRFSRRKGMQPKTFDVWVWCLDCRLLKIGAEAGSWQCRFFCKECCKRLRCEGSCVGRVEHVGYKGIEGELEAETERKHSRLEAGRIYVASGSSHLLRNKTHGGDLEREQEQEQEDSDDQPTAEWHHWFDNPGSLTFLPNPSPNTMQNPILTVP